MHGETVKFTIGAFVNFDKLCWFRTQ